ncbi:hypothetical protein [Azospirillum sp. TSO5]|uniref:hypothetical protein n=1 Tax=Azospirillum sp. TSO5 TaxID=716760 RepID=UPI000D641277|nr:hypothetical protein [Azospirillum sp. TSO5]
MTPDTLGNLTPGARLYARCPACGREKTLDVAVLVAHAGADCRVAEALRRVVCGECRVPATTWRGYDPIAENRAKPENQPPQR